jgi:hypothetical protein
VLHVQGASAGTITGNDGYHLKSTYSSCHRSSGAPVVLLQEPTSLIGVTRLAAHMCMQVRHMHCTVFTQKSSEPHHHLKPIGPVVTKVGGCGMHA